MIIPPYAPSDVFDQDAAAFSEIFGNTTTNDLISNVAVKMANIRVGDLRLPVTISDSSNQNAWVCSPITTYARYAQEETRRMAPYGFRRLLAAMIRLLWRQLDRAGLDNAVIINNWLLSTNIYPDPAGVDVKALVNSCREQWPETPIWFRSLNRVQHSAWITLLATAGFRMIATRQVYLFDARDGSLPGHQNLQRDFRLLDRTPLHRVRNDAFSTEDFSESATLYSQLYLHKYSKFNPAYTAEFIQRWHAAGLLKMTGFRSDDGVMRAVIGLFGQGQLLTAPIVGYDTNWPQSAGLYRLLMADVLRTTVSSRAILNLSAGAAHFKRLRGGVGTIEYSAVLPDHLPAAQQHAIRLLEFLTNRIGEPVMQRMKL